MQPYVIAILIFLIAYLFIVLELINKAAIALLGGSLIIVLGILSQEEAFTEFIDFNTIFFLIGMMIMIGILKQTGLFEYIAIKSVKISKGNPALILILLSIITAVFSAFLDNVTTVLLIIPVVISIVKRLGLKPFPISMAIIFSSNIGGTATMIGDPPNILIGSQTHLTFLEFSNNLAFISLLILVITIGLFLLIYKKDLLKNNEKKEIATNLNEKNLIKDKVLLYKSIIVLFLAILGFVFHNVIHLESATIALMAAALLLVITRINPMKIFHEIEWETIFFFVGLFIMVGALEKTGVIEMIAKWLLDVTKGNALITAISILWLSAILSAFLDNIPFTATMIPLIKITGEISGMDTYPLWWALALGACLGGNGTAIGASANVVSIGILKEHNIKISFVNYFKVGFPLMIISIIISTIYIIFRYY